VWYRGWPFIFLHQPRDSNMKPNRRPEGEHAARSQCRQTSTSSSAIWSTSHAFRLRSHKTLGNPVGRETADGRSTCSARSPTSRTDAEIGQGPTLTSGEADAREGGMIRSEALVELKFLDASCSSSSFSSRACPACPSCLISTSRSLSRKGYLSSSFEAPVSQSSLPTPPPPLTLIAPRGSSPTS